MAARRSTGRFGARLAWLPRLPAFHRRLPPIATAALAPPVAGNRSRRRHPAMAIALRGPCFRPPILALRRLVPRMAGRGVRTFMVAAWAAREGARAHTTRVKERQVVVPHHPPRGDPFRQPDDVIESR